MIRSWEWSSSRLSAAKASLLILVLLGAGGCASRTNAKPSDAEIQTAIMDKGAWNPLVGRVELQSVQIEEIGIFNTDKKYWPVKARVVTKAGREASLHYEVSRDDYGKWVARLADRS
jgi:hypothetical protein